MSFCDIHNLEKNYHNKCPECARKKAREWHRKNKERNLSLSEMIKKHKEKPRLSCARW